MNLKQCWYYLELDACLYFWNLQIHFLIKSVALIGIFVAVASYLNYDVISRILTFQTLMAFLIMQVPLFVATCLNAYRHSLLVRASAPFYLCFIALLLAAGLNPIIPARLSELVKAFICDKLVVLLYHGITAIFVERLYDVLVVMTIALLDLSFRSEHTTIIIIFSLCLLFFIFYLRTISLILIRYLGKPNSSFNKYLLAHLDHIANLWK